MMPGGSASPDAHNSRSDDGKGEFASEPTHEHAVWNFSFVSQHVCQTLVEGLRFSPHASGCGQNKWCEYAMLNVQNPLAIDSFLLIFVSLVHC